jgi:hypothetical protein
MVLGALLEVTLSTLALMGLMSLATSAINEFIADNLFNLRGLKLRAVVRRLLAVHLRKGPGSIEIAHASETFFENPNISMGMEKGSWFGRVLPGRFGPAGGLRLPSAIEPERYAQAMIELLAEERQERAREKTFAAGDGGQPAPDRQAPDARPVPASAVTVPRERLIGSPDRVEAVSNQIEALLADLGVSYRQKMAALQAEYDDIMVRATGWYLRETRMILFFIGLFLAVGANIDLLRYAQRLMSEEDLSARVAAAEVLVEKHDPFAGGGVFAEASGGLSDLDNLKVLEGGLDVILADFDALGVTIGWACEPVADNQGRATAGITWFCPANESYRWPSVSQVVGWFIIALGVTLGAQFWFDLFKQLVGLRTAGGTRDAQAQEGATA